VIRLLRHNEYDGFRFNPVALIIRTRFPLFEGYI